MYLIPGMNVLLQMTLMDEIVLQSQIAIRAFERINAAENQFDEIEIWGSIQSILVASANVSKILWPTKKYRERGKLLREYLQIDENHPLASRVFRNHFEHFDERVEERFNISPTGVYIDRQMNPLLNNFFDNREPLCQRGYNSFNQTLIFDGEVLNIKEVINSLTNLMEYFRVNRITLFFNKDTH